MKKKLVNLLSIFAIVRLLKFLFVLILSFLKGLLINTTVMVFSGFLLRFDFFLSAMDGFPLSIGSGVGPSNRPLLDLNSTPQKNLISTLFLGISTEKKKSLTRTPRKTTNSLKRPRSWS